jgi:hypothetical protein
MYLEMLSFLSNSSLGGGTGQSNLQINGSLGLAAQTVSSNTTIGESSLVFVNTASDNVKITLPYAGNCSGRIYSIKKTSSLHKICIKGGGNLIDLSGCLNLTTSSTNVLPYVKLLSDGHQWYDISQSTVSNTVAQSNLVGWWKLDGLSGNTALDSSSSQHHGTTQNGLTFADMPGKICGALEFDGTNDYVSVGDHDAYDFGTGNFTASFWVFRHTNALANLRAFSKGAGNDTVAEAGFAFFASDTLMTFMVNPSGTRVGAGSTYTANEWHHVVGVARSSANVAIYMDGQLKSVNNIGSGSFSGTAPVNIGCMPNSLYWDGLLDEVRLYNTALSSSEVLNLYLEGL